MSAFQETTVDRRSSLGLEMAVATRLEVVQDVRTVDRDLSSGAA